MNAITKVRKENFNDAVWVGVVDREENGNWTFLDGSPVTELLLKWGANEPNNAYKQEKCARFWGNGNKLFDYQCAYKSGALCQTVQYQNVGTDNCEP